MQVRSDFSSSEIKFYKYFFTGVDQPIIMEAENREMADQMLSLLPEKSGVQIDLKRLIDVKIEIPLLGVSKKKVLGKDYVWVGLQKTQDGWMDKDKFEDILND